MYGDWSNRVLVELSLFSGVFVRFQLSGKSVFDGTQQISKELLVIFARRSEMGIDRTSRNTYGKSLHRSLVNTAYRTILLRSKLPKSRVSLCVKSEEHSVFTIKKVLLGKYS